MLFSAMALMLSAAATQAAPAGATAEERALVGPACANLAARTLTQAEEIHSYASCLQHGEGRPVDLAGARRLFARSAEMGFAKSKCALGNMLIDGDGGETDVARSLSLCREAAEAGDPDAQADYGQRLLGGAAIARDPVAARRWLTAAAGQGQPNAALNLGKIYWNADGVERDKGEAVRWWRVAYENGNADAALLIANEALVRLMQGVEQPEDIDPTIMDDAGLWYSRAAREDTDAANRALAERMLSNLARMREELAE